MPLFKCFCDFFSFWKKHTVLIGDAAQRDGQNEVQAHRKQQRRQTRQPPGGQQRPQHPVDHERARAHDGGRDQRPDQVAENGEIALDAAAQGKEMLRSSARNKLN